MPPIWTVGLSAYSNLLRASIPGGAFFQSALYPPVPQSQFDVGTAFSYTGNGIVNTLGSIPPQEISPHIASGSQTLVPLLSQNVDTLNSLPIVNGSPMDITGLGIHSGPFVVSPEDSALNCYKARGFRDAALLVPASRCYRRNLLHTFSFDDSATWQSLKSALFAQGPQEIYLVTEIYTTNRWAVDYRPLGLPLPATYVVNVQQGFHGPEIAPDFQLHHNSLSGNFGESPRHTSEQYTILASYRPVQRRELGPEGVWLQPFKNVLARCARRFKFQRQRPIQSTMYFPMSTFGGVNSGTIVEQLSRLHLGGTFYLLEITQEGEISPKYVLESEGHQEGHSLDYFIVSLMQYGLHDWRSALAKVFPPEQFLESRQSSLQTTRDLNEMYCGTYPYSDGFGCPMSADWEN